MKARHVRRARQWRKVEQENRWRDQAVFRTDSNFRLFRYRLVCTAQQMKERAYFERVGY